MIGNRQVLLIRFLLLISITTACKKDSIPEVSKYFEKENTPYVDEQKLKQKADEALIFCKKKNYNTDFCILADLSLHSGVHRFFVYDFKNKKIIQRYLVGHGCGNSLWSLDLTKESPSFSNQDGSHLSSLGKYKIGERGYSDWGIHVKYVLHGLENSNSNAKKRFIVLHSWEKMSDQEVYPAGSPEGWGCPTLSNNAMKKVDQLLKNSKKPVLLWMYN